MKKMLILILLLIMAGAAVFPCAAADVDPILIDKPNPRVFECNEDLFVEIMVYPLIEYSTGGRRAKDYFLFLTAEFLYLREEPLNGLDKTSFILKRTDAEGNEELFPLNYMMTAMLGMKNGWKTMADPLTNGTLLKLNLVYDVRTTDRKGWSLLVRPAERGGEPLCETEIPLYVRVP